MFLNVSIYYSDRLQNGTFDDEAMLTNFMVGKVLSVISIYFDMRKFKSISNKTNWQGLKQ